MSMTILGLATAEPAQSIEQSEAARIAKHFLFDGREARLLPALFRRTQVPVAAACCWNPAMVADRANRSIRRLRARRIAARQPP